MNLPEHVHCTVKGIPGWDSLPPGHRISPTGSLHLPAPTWFVLVWIIAMPILATRDSLVPSVSLRCWNTYRFPREKGNWRMGKRKYSHRKVSLVISGFFLSMLILVCSCAHISVNLWLSVTPVNQMPWLNGFCLPCSLPSSWNAGIPQRAVDRVNKDWLNEISELF